MSDAAVDRALAAVDAGFPEAVERLKALIRIPSCSFPGYDPLQLQRSARATADWFRGIGLPEVDLIEGVGPFPYVLAHDRRAGSGRPTLLLYAHHDVQPPLDEERWHTPPYEPVERDGRLYGRGSADDKAGIAAHAAACAAWYASAGALPINVTVLIEGEEEIGSPHLKDFLAAHGHRLAADGIVIADLVNVARGVPTLTTSLRGLVALDVELQALDHPLHSGLWGGPPPDVVRALCELLGSLADDRGRPRIDGLALPEPPAALLRDLGAVPYDRDAFADSMGLIAEGRHLLGDGPDSYRRNWYEPALSVNAIRAGGERGKAGNVILDRAWARIGLRLVPGMGAADSAAALEATLRKRAPSWARLTIGRGSASEAWSTATDDPLFAQARAAFHRGYGREAVAVGSGGSIPFVGELCRRLGAPALLVPVEDPDTRPHAENESVPLDDLRKTARSLAALFGMV